MNYILLINLKLLTIANSSLLSLAEHENFSANKYEIANYHWHFDIYKQRKFCAQLIKYKKSFITSGPDNLYLQKEAFGALMS